MDDKHLWEGCGRAREVAIGRAIRPKKNGLAVPFRKQVEATRAEAEKDGVTVPTTLEEYCLKSGPRRSEEMADSIDFDECFDYGDDDSGLCCADAIAATRVRLSRTGRAAPRR